MNEFEKRINALRIQFRDERISITKDAYRTLGRLNTAIGKVGSVEARDALRAEKRRVYEAMRTSHRYSRLCYMQQLEAIEDEYRMHLDKTPSNRQLRRIMRSLSQTVEARGEKSITISLGENHSCTISFDQTNSQ